MCLNSQCWWHIFVMCSENMQKEKRRWGSKNSKAVLGCKKKHVIAQRRGRLSKILLGSTRAFDRLQFLNFFLGFKKTWIKDMCLNSQCSSQIFVVCSENMQKEKRRWGSKNSKAVLGSNKLTCPSLKVERVPGMIGPFWQSLENK